MNTQLATRQLNTAIEPAPDFVPVAGIEQLSPDDFSLPVFKLVQTNTKIDNAEQFAGQWYRTDTGEIVESPRALIIGIVKNRALFESEYDGGGKPLCRSDDSITPRSEFIGSKVYWFKSPNGAEIITAMSADEGDPHNMIIPATCAECPLSQWGKDGTPPPCRLSDNWAALTGDGDPVLIRFGGSSAKVSAKLRNLARATTAKRKGSLYIRLGSHFEHGDKGQYYVPDVTSIRETPPEDLIETAKAFMGLNLAARAVDMMSDEELGGGNGGTYASPQRADALDWDAIPEAMEEETPF